MDTTIVIEAWTSALTPTGLMYALSIQFLIVLGSVVVGYIMGRDSK